MTTRATAAPPAPVGTGAGAGRPRSPHPVPARAVPALLLALTAALVLATALAIGVGTVSVPLGAVLAVVRDHLTGAAPTTSPLHDQIVWQFRAPRVLLAAVAGAALSLAGVCLQTLVRNPLADPYLFGVTSGASLGAVIALTATGGVTASLGVAGSAFAGSLLTLTAVFLLAQRGGRLAGTDLVLAGVAVAYLGSAATSYLQLQANPAELRGVMFWLLGSVANAGWDDLAIPAATTAAVAALLLTRGRAMNALAVGDDTAAGLGVDVHRLRITLLLTASLLTATVVSAVGGIGFVGLIVPHAVRLLVGPDHRRVLPVTLLTGALFLVLVDLVTRTVDRPNEMPVGIFTAALGAPFFLVLLRRRRSSQR